MILPTTQKKPNHNHSNPNNHRNNQQTWYDRQKRRWDGSGRRRTASALTSTRPSARTRRSTSWPSSWARARRCVNLWIERWRRCIFMIFLEFLFFSCSFYFSSYNIFNVLSFLFHYLWIFYDILDNFILHTHPTMFTT